MRVSRYGWGAPATAICAFSGRFGRDGRIIFLTVPGIVVLGCSIFREVSRFSSAILADLAVRGFAISFVTSACVAFLGSLVPSYLSHAACTHDGIETEVIQSHFAQSRNIRAIHIVDHCGVV